MVFDSLSRLQMPQISRFIPTIALNSRDWLRSLSLAAIAALVTSLPVKAAERLYLIYSPISWSVKVSSLETFAKEGKVDKNLQFYFDLGGVKDEATKAQFRQALLKKVEVNPVSLSRFFNTEIGEDILTRIGNLIAIQGGRNGKYALRGALVQAAMDPQGLTLLNFLRKLPTNMQLNLEQMVTLAKEGDLVIEATNIFTFAIAKISEEEAASDPPVNFASLPDLRQRGELGVSKQTWKLNDISRQRQFYVDVYKPQQWRAGKTPVVILSHGLASRPEDYGKRAEHLASYGFVVALPQHPGSDITQAQALLEGYSRQVFDVNEFINRPKDVSYVIDELQRRNQSEFEGRLNLESVGLIGHSFGGYTVLALAGAEIDFENLAKDCQSEVSNLNISLLLQCRALKLPRQVYNFRDPRVASVIATNPVNSSIFGSQGLSKIQIPVMLGSGSYDPATPAVFEQVRSFNWLTSRDRYLGLAEGQAHVDFSELDAGALSMLESFEDLTLPSPDLLNNYADSLSLAFFEFYIANNPKYRPYLQASYSTYLSQGEQFKLFLISAASSEQFRQAIAKFRSEYNLQ